MSQFEFQNIFRRYSVELLIVVVGCAIIHAIFLSDAFRDGTKISPSSAGLLGDFIGGYIGTTFALLSVVLLYTTLKSQRKTAALQNFESRYFELLKMHRDNVAELQIGDSEGRKLFVLLMREFRACADQIKEVATRQKLDFTSYEMLELGYYVLYFGVGPNSSRMLKTSLAKFDTSFIAELEHVLNTSTLKEKIKAERRLGYLPFEGHQSRLGHYYRHLFQMITFVDHQKIDIDKYEYIKTIRAQLTNHEQAFLLINSLTPMGRAWWDRNLMIKFKMVRNLPEHFFDENTEFDTTPIFGHQYFE